jgi:branched-chain amino acid transport system substrate-binding protein
MRKMKVGLPCMGAVALAALTWCTTASADEPFKLGWNTELSGPWTFTGNACLDGAKMATAEVNSSNKLIDLIVRDNQTNPAQASALARSMDFSDKIDLISGSTNSDTALAIYGYAEQAKLPYLVPVAAFTELTKPGTTQVFRMEPDAVGWGYAVAKFVGGLKKNATVGIMMNDFAVNRGVLAGFKYQAPRDGLNIIDEVIFPQTAMEAGVQVAQMKAKHPDYVLVAGGSGAFDVTLTSQLLDIGFRPDQLVHPYGSTSKQVTAWGARSAGSYYGTFFDRNIAGITDAGRAFVQAFREKNGYSPGFIEHNCYIAVNFLGELVAAGAHDRDSIRSALRAAHSKEKTTGVPIYFDQNGARVNWMYFMQLDGLTKDDFTAHQVNYLQWNSDALPVYDLVK